MQKKWLAGFPGRESQKKLWKIMKLTIGLIISFMMTVSANSYSQKTKLDVNLSNTTILGLFKYIEQNSEFVFLYRSEDFNTSKKVDVEFKEATINQILDEVLKGENVTYDVYERQIIIRKSIDPANEQQQQKRMFSGSVKDSKGVPLPGVSVVVKGSTIGTMTDTNGNFTLQVPPAASTLAVSFIGMKSIEVPLTGKTTLNISMEEETVGIEEVVAVGYGTIRKSDMTGSVYKVSVQNATDNPSSSIEQMLQGRASGVQIIQSSGAPGAGLSFLIRGANSTSNNQPLIVIDGFPIDAGSGDLKNGGDANSLNQPPVNPLANLNPNEIESVEILKDASSTAIYGSRGANGVVLITTKRGKKGMDRIEFNYRTDVSQIQKKLEVLNSNDFLAYSNEAAANSGIAPYYADTTITRLSKTNYNWQDEIFRMAISKDYQLGISGGEGKTNYSFIGNYSDLEGIVGNSSFKRGGIRLNLDREFSKKMNVALNFNASRSNSKMAPSGSTTGLISSNVILSALYFKPFSIPYNSDGAIDQTLDSNPMTMINLVKDDYTNTVVFGNLTVKLNLTKYLIFNTNIGANYSSMIRRSYYPRGTYTGSQNSGYAYENQANRFNYLSEFTLNYNRQIGKNNINAVLGQTYQRWQTDVFAESAGQFPNDNLAYYSFQTGNAPGVPNSSYQEWSLASFLSRINYSLLGKYLITFTGRYDGASRLAEGHKWAFFPSVAMGWNVHKERFLKSVKFINNLKIRASYGISGNQSVGIGQNLAFLTMDRGVINEAIQSGYIMSNIANPTLGWENTKQLNAGVDLGVLGNRLIFEFNIYKKNTSNLLIALPIPTSNGFSSYTTNAGEVENKGMEFDLTVKAIDKKLQWTIVGNLSFNRNKMLDMGPLGDNGSIFGPNYLNTTGGLSQPLHVTRKGLPIGSFFGYKINGIYQNKTEVAAGPESATAKPGDSKFIDISGPAGIPDGKITADDRTIIGNAYPDYTFGVTNDFSYHNFSLSFFFQGVMGNDVINLSRFIMDALTTNNFNVFKQAYDGRWKGEGTSNKYPAPRAVGGFFNSRFSDFIVEDGSYIRLKNITIGYNLPVEKMHIDKWIKGAKAFVTGSNLLTITNYSGYDPEVSSNWNNPLSPGVDIGSYPQVKTYSFGVNLKF